MLRKTKHKDTDQDTYVLRYMTFNVGDFISLFDGKSGYYGYRHLVFLDLADFRKH